VTNLDITARTTRQCRNHIGCTDAGNRGVAASSTARCRIESINQCGDRAMTKPVASSKASPQVRAVFDDIKASRNVPDVNNFWKHLANDPALLQRTWESVKATMAPGALDPLVKEMLYLAVSVTNGCGYCIASHTAAARKAGMSEAMFGELMAVVGMANETNRLANGYRVPIDAAFDK
jgi:AhpD family alkylhydroperoxidase